MIKVFKKYKNFFNDIVLNTVAFGIYMFAQQIVLMPYLAKNISEPIYAKLLIYISMLNLICNSFGSQLGVSQQVSAKNDENNNNAYIYVLFLLSLFISFVSIIFLIILRYSFFDIMVLTIILLLANHRFYMRYIFRIEGDYKKIIIQNTLYFIGIILGIITFIYKKIFFIPLLIAEILCFMYDYIYGNKHSFKKISRDSIKSIFSIFSGYSIASILSNACSLIDKLLVSPLLGKYNLIIYTVGSTISKILALITNPVNDVILAWISKEKNNSNRIISLSIKISAVLLIVFSLINIPIIFLFTKILYPQYLESVNKVLLLLSISGSFTFVVSLMKSFVIRYSKSTKLMNTYLINLLIFSIFGFLGAKLFGLNGFIISTLISRLQLWITFVVDLKKILKNGEKEL